MIKSEEWHLWEKELLREVDLSIDQKFQILDAMFVQARGLGAFSPDDILEGIDIDIQLAKAVNSVPRAA